MRTPAVPLRKQIAHRLKHSWYQCAPLDAWVDAKLDEPAPSEATWRSWPRENLLHRLLPERRLRSSPFGPRTAERTEIVRVLTLVPPEDTGGGSRPAQLAAELHRRGFRIEWRWALPIFPWPRLRRPVVAGVDARHVDDPPADTATADLVLLEAPHPRLCELARSGARSGPLIYDAIDVWDGALGAGWYDLPEEDRIVAEADHLVASAHLLRDELAARSGRAVQLLPNAVDLDRFRPDQSAAVGLQSGTPTVAYVGALWGEWLDLSLVEGLARRCPDAEIHLIGPPGSRATPAAANLHLHGPRPRDEIPGLLASADVAIVPFAPGRLSAAVSPLKVFEYLAMERPVVSTRLPDLEGVPGVTIADDAEAFARAVESAPRKPFPRDAVRTFLADHTWSRRVDQLLALTRPGR
jgi:glycosyltransferase involved in cell wall biosynthesis